MGRSRPPFYVEAEEVDGQPWRTELALSGAGLRLFQESAPFSPRTDPPGENTGPRTKACNPLSAKVYFASILTATSKNFHRAPGRYHPGDPGMPVAIQEFFDLKRITRHLNGKAIYGGFAFGHDSHGLFGSRLSPQLDEKNIFGVRPHHLG